MRENCTYGSMRGIRRKTAKHVLRVAEGRAGVPCGGVPLYSTPFWFSSERGTNSVYSANQLNKDKELKCGGYDYGVDVESDDVQIYGPPGKNPPAGRYLW
jgi:hypothetical protein